MNESEILLQSLVSIRDTLLDLAIQKASLPLTVLNEHWTRVNQIIKELAGLRANRAEIESSEELDSLLEDVVPLFFQSWSKEGKVALGMYPTYVKACKLHHGLKFQQFSGLFTLESCAEIATQIQILADEAGTFESVCSQTGECYRQGEALLLAKIRQCEETLHLMQIELNNVASALLPIHDRLVSIQVDLQTMKTRNDKRPHTFSLAQVQMFQEELREIDSARIDGKYIARDGSIVPGQALVIDLLESCFDDVHELLATRDTVSGDNALRPVYEDLIRMKLELERMESANKWAPGADLVSIQMKLGEIDNLRVDGKFMVDDSIPPGQAILHFLLHKMASEPVAEPLMPIYNQLMTLQKCLDELVKWKVELSSRELVPYQMKLASIDRLRIDGKFMDGSDVPEGQALLNDLLEGCYDKLRVLQCDCTP